MGFFKVDEAKIKKEESQIKKSPPIVLKNVNFLINPGDYAAFVGMSGTGKSTAIKLIHRFYNPNSGGI